jgi:hypothetical protein
MSSPVPEKPPENAPPENTDRGDMIALGIGCLVFVIMLIAVVMVAITRE